MNQIEKYYNKFNEHKRLTSRHGIVEFTISMEFILKHLSLIGNKPLNILDVGAGTGRYSGYLNSLGHNVTAVELVKKNLSVLKQNYPNVTASLGNATNLKKFNDNSFDAVILFGPMYHLHQKEEQLMALAEAKRVVKSGGVIFVAYLLSSYAVVRHGFMDNTIHEEIERGKLDKNFNIISCEEDLYFYTNLNYINQLNNEVNLKRLEIISPDGPTDYIRQHINKLSEQNFNIYLDFVRQNATNPHTIGASSHIVDILTKQ